MHFPGSKPYYIQWDLLLKRKYIGLCCKSLNPAIWHLTKGVHLIILTKKSKNIFYIFRKTSSLLLLDELQYILMFLLLSCFWFLLYLKQFYTVEFSQPEYHALCLKCNLKNKLGGFFRRKVKSMPGYFLKMLLWKIVYNRSGLYVLKLKLH